MSGISDLHVLLKSLQPSLSPQKYAFISLPMQRYAELANSIQAKCVFYEEEGVTLIVCTEQAEKFHLDYHSVFRQITLTVHSSLESVGLTAAFSRALANNNISANVVAGYYHDHIFVQDKDAVLAQATLEQLSQQQN